MERGYTITSAKQIIDWTEPHSHPKSDIMKMFDGLFIRNDG